MQEGSGMSPQDLSLGVRTGQGLFPCCLIAARTTFLTVPLAAPQSYAALKRLLGGTSGR
jgi:hypothetical protein